MTSLFIIESPFQLLSAIEAKQKLYISDAILIIRYTTNDTTNIQINKLLQIAPWKTIVKIKSTFSIFDSNLKLLLQLLKLKNRQFDNIFIGEYRSWILRSFFYNLTANKTYLLDDGAASISIYNQYIKKNTPANLQLSKLDKILLGLYKLNGLNIHGDVNLLFFTSFNIPTPNCVQNDFSFIKSIMSKQTILESTTYFFGAPLSENNIIPEKLELEYIQKIINDQVEIGKHLIYIPHRRESEHKKNKIKSLQNCKISTFEFPAEIEFIFRKEKPIAIASFYSTVLQTLPLIYYFKEVTAYKIPSHKILKKYQSSINFVYKEYSKSTTIQLLDS